MKSSLAKAAVSVLHGLAVVAVLGWAGAARAAPAPTDEAGPSPRPAISLDRTLDFATDPQQSGERAAVVRPGAPLPLKVWPGYAPKTNGKILVPGIWDNQGYGTETEKVCHNFVGKGWYKRAIAIPSDWAGRRVFLDITGAPLCQGLGRWPLPASKSAIFPLSSPISPIASWPASWPRSRSRSIPSSDGRRTRCSGPRPGRLHGRGLGRHLGPRDPGGRADAWLSDLFIQRRARLGTVRPARVRGKASLAATARWSLRRRRPWWRSSAELAPLPARLVEGRSSRRGTIPGAISGRPARRALHCPALAFSERGMVRGRRCEPVRPA